jgi:hypothetical protein
MKSRTEVSMGYFKFDTDLDFKISPRSKFFLFPFGFEVVGITVQAVQISNLHYPITCFLLFPLSLNPFTCR